MSLNSFSNSKDSMEVARVFTKDLLYVSGQKKTAWNLVFSVFLHKTGVQHFAYYCAHSNAKFTFSQNSIIFLYFCLLSIVFFVSSVIQ